MNSLKIENMKNKSIGSIKPGTTILTEQPFAFVLKSKLRTEACDHCLERGKVLKCSVCQYVYYCNRNCQREAWSLHKLECSNLKQIAPKILPDSARLMARLILKLQKGGDHEKSYYSENKFRKFKDLMSHYSDIKIEQKRQEHFTSMCAVLFEYLKNITIPNSAELMGIYGRMCINSYNILDPEMNSVGTGLYLAASIIDHSCDPSAVAVFKGTTINIRTVKSLPSLNWQEIFISYIDVLNSPFGRQEALQQAYYFLCKCPRCLHDGQNLIMFSGVCPNKDCTAPIIMNNNGSKKDDNSQKCSACNAEIGKKYIDNYRSVEEFTEMQLKTMEQKSMAYVKTLDTALESCIELGRWSDAIFFGKQLIDGYKYYYGEIHPMLGLLYLKLGKILVYENKSSEALKYLQESANILHITHGPCHSLCRTELDPLLKQATLESSIINSNGY